jgi:hypothetical protein
VINTVTLKIVKDLHTLVVHGDDIYTCSTETDQIIKISLDRKFNLSSESVFWSLNDIMPVTRNDQYHLNSLGVFNGEWHCTAFGNRDSDMGWKNATSGFLFNISKQAFLLEDLYHPHTYYVHGSDQYICESSRGNLYHNNKKIALTGYLRGLLATENALWVGVSGKRRVSKSTQSINEIDDNRSEFYASIIKLRLPGYKIIKKYSLLNHITEIYDIIEISDFEPKKEYWELGDLSFKVQYMEDEILKLRATINKDQIGPGFRKLYNFYKKIF